jgi:hypothetical protein
LEKSIDYSGYAQSPSWGKPQLEIELEIDIDRDFDFDPDAAFAGF